MARGRRVTRDDDDALAAWTAAQEIAAATGLIPCVVLTPAPAKGRWRMVTRALHAADGSPVAVAVQFSTLYPSSTAVGLAGALWARMLELDTELSKWDSEQGRLLL